MLGCCSSRNREISRSAVLGIPSSSTSSLILCFGVDNGTTGGVFVVFYARECTERLRPGNTGENAITKHARKQSVVSP